MTETQAVVALTRIVEIWEQLFPAEQARTVRTFASGEGHGHPQ